MLLLRIHTVLLLVSTALASWDNNLNYRSPSVNHDGLGINLRKVHKRMLTKRDGSTPYQTGQLNFTHGVASGDPWETSIILWTRVSPQYENDRSNVTVEGTVPLFSHETEEYIHTSSSPICVDWRVATTPDMSGAAATSGTAYTTSDIDYTIKVEAKGLNPFTTYYYQFTVCDTQKSSPIGRTKTSPTEDDSLTPLSFAVFSCSNYPNGYFNAYGNAARKDNFDYAIHLGDYIYETARGNLSVDPRAANPQREIVTLYDYRTRIAQYRSDLDLTLIHQQHPFITVWDDHEIANNNYRDGSSAMNNTEQTFNKYGGVSFDKRKMNAVRAYFEWMPLRQADLDDNLRIWRSFKMGKLVDLIMLDTRSYDRSITSLGWNNEYVYEISNDAGRSLMGSRQENWFYNSLLQSKERGATWRVIGNQIVFSRINSTSTLEADEAYIPFNVDAWDGYTGNRNRTFKHLYDNMIGNNIMLAGDSHQNWVSDMVWLGEEGYDPATGAGSIGVEFAGTAVSSSGPGGNLSSNIEGSQLIVRDNQELQWQEGYYRGYYELHIDAQKIEAQFYGSPSVASRNPYEVSLANFTVYAGDNHLARPVAGGVVASGAIQEGEVRMTNLTLNTETGEWGYQAAEYNTMFISYPSS
ncbi:hypothetical protein LTR24_002432 [Lithohypha guttulata]|uniref:Alkaline phosphatase n=1 Tax=Lithohypha guttulata TaxID=1690604 RepID=A0ABR0KHX5_9EURO|nr:hypothetical protein LTR24_002432 [Lithohypha guttulata]